VYLTAQNDYSYICSKGNSTTREYGLTVRASSIQFYWSTTGSSAGDSNVSASFTFDLGTWYHVAMSKSGTSVRLFVNGTQQGSTGTFTTVYNGSSPFRVGTFMDFTGIAHNFAGYLSNLRIVKGTAVYTSNFTPSTTPLTAITNTSLLTCQSNRFVDNSASPLTITVNGTPSVQRFNPFGASAAYSTSVIGGSGYFDGSGDYLQSGNEASLAIGTDNFTIELWANRLSGTNNGLFQLGTTAGGFRQNDVNNLALAFASGGLTYYANNNTYAPSVTVNSNSWNHLALVRSGTTTTLYFNGVSVSSITDSTNYTGTYLVVGGYYDTTYVWNGYISNFRIVKGTAVYTANFTPPTAPVTAITNTQLLLNYTNGAIFDNAMMNDLETVGNAQISTSVVKYGTGSLKFDGTGDYLNSTNSLLAIQGSIAFTLEAWIYPTSVAGDLCIYETRGGSGFVFFINSGGKLQVYDSVAALQTQSTTTLTANTWTFISLVRAAGSSTVTYYVDGTSAGTFSLASFATATRTRIGARGDAVAAYVGYIDDFRITIGYARYTSNFTPPTSALSDTGPY